MRWLWSRDRLRSKTLGGIINTYKIKFDFEIEVNCEQENINDEVLKWWMSASENLYPFYKIEAISQEEIKWATYTKNTIS